MLTSWRTAPRRPPSPRRLRRHGRRWPWLAALVPLAVAGGLWALRDRSPRAAVAVAAPPAATPSGVGFAAPDGVRTTGARCLMVMVDESSSMTSADAAGTRADAVTATARFLAAYGVDGDRVGATWFADAADVQAPVPAATAATLDAGPGRRLGSGTEIGPALDATYTALAAGCGSARGAVVLVSDGAASGVADFAAVGDAIAAHPDVAVHLVAMNGGGAFEASRSFWENASLGIASVQTIDSFGSDEVAGAVAAILSAETGQQVVASPGGAA